MLSLVGLLSCDEGADNDKCEFNKASTTSFPEDCGSGGGGNDDGWGIGDGDCGVESLK